MCPATLGKSGGDDNRVVRPDFTRRTVRDTRCYPHDDAQRSRSVEERDHLSRRPRSAARSVSHRDVLYLDLTMTGTPVDLLGGSLQRGDDLTPEELDAAGVVGGLGEVEDPVGHPEVTQRAERSEERRVGEDCAAAEVPDSRE